MRTHRLQRRLNLLSVERVRNADIGDHNDGGGLVLRIDECSARWAFRYTSPTGKRREMGLGAADRNNAAITGQSITNARKDATDARELLRQGKDPIDERNKRREVAKAAEASTRAEAARTRTTLARVARAYHERVIEPTRTAKHGAQWISSLENHVPRGLWHAPIDSIAAPALLDFFIEVQGRVPETASRIVQRLRAVFGDAEFRGWCTGNPADAAARKLREAQGRRERGSFAALPFAEVPAFMRRLRAQKGIAARALEFAVLTAARTGEVIGARWPEFDLAATTWTVPAGRMKGGEAHVVYLAPRAVEILRDAQQLGSAHVFPSPAELRAPLSNMAMLALLRRMDADKRTTVHGLARATFSTWAHECGAARADVIEVCLAHREQDRVRRAYNRAQFMQERRALLAAWADYCDGRAPAQNVLEFSRSKVSGGVHAN